MRGGGGQIEKGKRRRQPLAGSAVEIGRGFRSPYLHLSQTTPPSSLSFFYRGMQVLRGVSSPPPQWRQCVRAADSMLGYELGQLFVKAAYSDSSLTETKEMLSLVRQAFKARLQEVRKMELRRAR